MSITGYARVGTVQAGATALSALVPGTLKLVSRNFQARTNEELIAEVPLGQRPAAFPFVPGKTNRIGERSTAFRNLSSRNLGYLTDLRWRVAIVASYARSITTMPDQVAEPLITSTLDVILGSDTLQGRGVNPVCLATAPVDEGDTFRDYEGGLVVFVDFVSTFPWRQT